MREFKAFETLEKASAALESPVVTIGNFDGIHLGHQELLRRTRRAASEAGAAGVALTFRPHPVRFFKPDAAEFRLTTDRQKFELIRSEGLDAVVALEFDDALSNLPPLEFAERILAEGVGAKRVIVGANFAFGRDRAGSTDDLVRLGEELGFDTVVCDEVTHDGAAVSSTRIREALRAGRVTEARELLGRNHRLAGTVVSGEGRGSDLGFPTANLEPENLCPADGIYATYFHTSERKALPAATSIGWRPTFDEERHVVESYVLGRDDLDLYGENAELEFVEYIRAERAFDSSQSLVEQMHEDVERVREVLDDVP